jgi:hypothetical protein
MFLERVIGFYLHDTQSVPLQVWQEYRENEDLLDRIWDRLQVLPKSLRRSSSRASLTHLAYLQTRFSTLFPGSDEFDARKSRSSAVVGNQIA